MQQSIKSITGLNLNIASSIVSSVAKGMSKTRDSSRASHTPSDPGCNLDQHPHLESSNFDLTMVAQLGNNDPRNIGRTQPGNEHKAASLRSYRFLTTLVVAPKKVLTENAKKPAKQAVLRHR